MDKLTPKDAWDQDAELDRLDGKEVTGITADCDVDYHTLSEYTENDREWFDDIVDDEFLDDHPITEKEAMELARLLGGDW
ncbi:MAG: hypothetical protein ISS69_13955 [Phycisphaerae bacterium]|nr:hypothetical protein [Phycisphaerae bacterium]